MLSPGFVTKQSPFLGEECAFCKNPLAPGDEVILCPEDSSRHHTHCWRANGNKCAAYGCRGQGEIESSTDLVSEQDPELVEERPSSRPQAAYPDNRVRRAANRSGCGQGCFLVAVAIAIIFFSIGCFGLWAIADYIMLEVLGWGYRVPEASSFLPPLLAAF